MKIVGSEQHPGFKFTDVYPFVPEDASEAETFTSGYFSVVHPNPLRKEVGIRINLTKVGNEPYTLAEIDTYIAGLLKSRAIAAKIETKDAPPVPGCTCGTNSDNPTIHRKDCSFYCPF